jgi:hypothetical protein
LANYNGILQQSLQLLRKGELVAAQELLEINGLYWLSAAVGLGLPEVRRKQEVGSVLSAMRN